MFEGGFLSNSSEINFPDDFNFGYWYGYNNSLFSCFGKYMKNDISALTIKPDNTTSISSFKNQKTIRMDSVGFYKNFAYVIGCDFSTNYMLTIFNLSNFQVQKSIKFSLPPNRIDYNPNSCVTIQHGKFVIFQVFNRSQLAIIRESNKTVSVELIKRECFNVFNATIFYNDKKKLLFFFNQLSPLSIITYHLEKDVTKIITLPREITVLGKWHFAFESRCLLNVVHRSSQQIQIIAFDTNKSSYQYVNFSPIPSSITSKVTLLQLGTVNCFEVAMNKFVLVTGMGKQYVAHILTRLKPLQEFQDQLYKHFQQNKQLCTCTIICQ